MGSARRRCIVTLAIHIQLSREGLGYEGAEKAFNVFTFSRSMIERQGKAKIRARTARGNGRAEISDFTVVLQ